MRIERLGVELQVCNCAWKWRSEADTNVTDLIAGYKELIVCTN
jgi:hypothetical protein